jgi:hypothetical protein
MEAVGGRRFVVVSRFVLDLDLVLVVVVVLLLFLLLL